MIIAIDGNEANVEKKVGVSVYTLELLKYFQKNATKDIRFTVFLRTQPNNSMPPAGPYYSYKIVPGPFAWSQIFLPLYLLYSWIVGIRFSVFFSPAHYSPRLLFCNSVVTIHDLSYVHYPDEFLQKDLYQLTQWTRYSVNRASVIISVSEATKKDIIQTYGFSSNKVNVVYNGYTEGDISSQSKRQFKPYILYVGTIQPRKNITTLVSAFEVFSKNHPEFTLKIAGKNGWMYHETLKRIDASYVRDKIELLGFVDDKKKNELYKNAFCTVLPSLYEGFGLPLLEAMNFGSPVLASNTSSLPEIGGDAAIYFDPHSAEQLNSCMETLYTNTSLRSECVRKGFIRVKHFSWDLCGKNTLAILTQNAS